MEDKGQVVPCTSAEVACTLSTDWWGCQDIIHAQSEHRALLSLLTCQHPYHAVEAKTEKRTLEKIEDHPMLGFLSILLSDKHSTNQLYLNQNQWPMTLACTHVYQFYQTCSFFDQTALYWEMWAFGASSRWFQNFITKCKKYENPYNMAVFTPQPSLPFRWQKECRDSHT